MKRDLELIRKIILWAETSPISEIEIDGYTDDQIEYHSYLMVDAGLANGIDVATLNDETPRWQILHLTWAGHDFADAARDEATWKKATGLVKDKAGTATFEIIKDVLVSVIKRNIGLP